MSKTKRSVLVPVFLVLSVVGFLYCICMLWLNSSIAPKDKTDSDLRTVELTSNNIKTISKQLEEAGVINNSLSFLLRAQLSGTAGKLGYGTYYLSPDMDADKIIEIIARGEHDNTQTVSVRIQEGDTIEAIANKLYESNVIYDKEKFLELCKTGDGFIGENNYPYLEENEETPYALEGYLFPDTYDFYYNSLPESVISKLLNRFNELYTAELQMQATQMGYTTKDVVTLASIIQKEANEDDFSKVSAVLYNRLNNNMHLQCDSTIRYITNSSNTMNLTSEQYNYKSPYNSYSQDGLIPGPICSPSLSAIKAVLNPDNDFVTEGYFYFCSTDSSTNSLVFAKTYQEHLENVKQYKGSWEDYDKTVKEN